MPWFIAGALKILVADRGPDHIATAGTSKGAYSYHQPLIGHLSGARLPLTCRLALLAPTTFRPSGASKQPALTASVLGTAEALLLVVETVCPALPVNRVL